jgi:polar amino acid transport system permease protein
MSSLEYAWSVLPELLRGLKVSIEATVLAMTLALITGLPICLLRVSTRRTLRMMGTAYVTLLRNTPLLAQLYVYFYILPDYGVTLSALTVGVLGLGTHFSAYVAETYRAGYLSVGVGQWEGAASVGLSHWDTLRLVVAPQAVRPAIPALANYLLAMFKDTSILIAVTVTELFGTVLNLASASYRFTLLYLMMGAIYLAVSYPSGRLISRLELRLGRV